MNLAEALKARRAVRAYAPRAVEEATIHALLHAAVEAPSAMNAQPWLFAIVQDKKLLDRWSDRAKAMLLDQAAADPKTRHYRPMLEEPSFNIFYDASTLVVIGARERGRYTEADCWLAAENLMLAACDAGLSSCPIGFAVQVLNTREAKERLGFPESGVVVAPILLGYAAAAVEPVPRREPEVVCWIR